MAVYWVQHYFTLPVIFEDIGMGDEQQNRRLPALMLDTDPNQRGTSTWPFL